MLMVISHASNIDSRLCDKKVVLSVDADFYSVLEKVSPSGNIYCAISVINSCHNPPIHINIPGDLDQVVDKINITIANVKKLCT